MSVILFFTWGTISEHIAYQETIIAVILMLHFETEKHIKVGLSLQARKTAPIHTQ